MATEPRVFERPFFDSLRMGAPVGLSFIFASITPPWTAEPGDHPVEDGAVVETVRRRSRTLRLDRGDLVP